MKCLNCGAQIGLDVKKCPFCGTINDIAIKREEGLETLREQNEEFAENVLKKSREEIYYRIHKRINIALGAIIGIAFLALFAFAMFTEDYVSAKDRARVLELYENQEFEELYYYMSDNDIFGKEGFYDYSHMALMWNAYNDCKLNFACAYDQYMLEGKYSTWKLENCVDNGYDVLTGYISYVYEDMPPKNEEYLKMYQEEVRMLFVGVLCIPEEMLSNLEKNDYEKIDELKAYVLEVLPNED